MNQRLDLVHFANSSFLRMECRPKQVLESRLARFGQLFLVKIWLVVERALRSAASFRGWLPKMKENIKLTSYEIGILYEYIKTCF